MRGAAAATITANTQRNTQAQKRLRGRQSADLPNAIGKTCPISMVMGVVIYQVTRKKKT